MSKTITIPTGVGNPVSVVVNGRKFSYPAGTTQTVPDEVAAIFESNSMEHVSYGRRAGAPLSAEGPLNDNEFLPVFATSDGRLRIRKSDLEELIHSGVVANPTLAGTEADLTGLQVGDTKYKVPAGGGGVLVVHVTATTSGDSTIHTCDKTAGEMYEAMQTGVVVIAPYTEDSAIQGGVCAMNISGGHFEFIIAGSGIVFTAESASDYPSYASGGK